MPIRMSKAEAKRHGIVEPVKVKKPNKPKSLCNGPKPRSHLLLRIDIFCEQVWDCPKPESEYFFDEYREWRFDAAWPGIKVAFEYEGIFSKKSRHTSITGYTGDIEKYNSAAIQGWIVIRATAVTVKNGQAFLDLERAITARTS